MNVGRQRHAAEAVDPSFHRLRELHNALGGLQRLHNARVHRLPAAFQHKRTAHRNTAATHQDQPLAPAHRAQQQKLHLAARWLARCHARSQHARVIEDQQVARAQQMQQIRKVVVGREASRARQVHQARTVARLQRSLRNELRGQVVIQLSCFHQ